MTARSGDQSVTGRQIFSLINTLQTSRQSMFRQLGTGNLEYEDDEGEEGGGTVQHGRAEDSDGSEEEGNVRQENG